MAHSESVAAKWQLGSIVDYYDHSQSCLIELPSRLAALSETDRAVALSTVRGEVERLTTALTAEALQRASVSVMEDLYKSGSELPQWDPATADYINAMWGTFFNVLSRRGYLIQYVVENTFPEHLGRPLKLFPELFDAASVVYACPHQLATRLPEADGVEKSIDGLRPLIAEARHIARMIAAAAAKRRRHLVYLEVDFESGCLDDVLALSNIPGVIHVFRNQAPEPGSTVQVSFPTAPFDC